MPFVALTLLLVIAIPAASGCGDSGEDQRIDIDDILMEEGDSFTFEGNEGDLVVLASDNTFRAAIAGEVKNGAYDIFQSEDAIRLELVFEDRNEETGEFESWDIVKNEDGNVVLTDLRGQSFTLKGSKEGLRRN